MVDKAFIYAYEMGNPSWPVLAYVDLAGFKLTEIPLSLPPKCWNSKPKMLYLAESDVFPSTCPYQLHDSF